MSMLEKIRDMAEHIEKTGILPQNLLQLAFDEKLFKLFMPIELGGRMLELPKAIRIFQEVSSVDGSFGWLVTIGSGGNMFVPNIDPQHGLELFSPAEAVIAGSGYPSGKAYKNSDGYRVTGEWKYCSGASYATIFTMNSIVIEDGKTTDEVISLIMVPKQVQVIEDWDAFGLRGTGSHTIKVEDEFVPFTRTFSISKQKNNLGGLVHTFPFVQFSQSSFTAVCLGIGQNFLQEARKIADQKKENGMENYGTLSILIEKQVRQFKDAEQQFHTLLDKLWKVHVKEIELLDTDLERFTQVCKDSVETTFNCANSLARYLGMDMVRESTTLNRIWRDLYTAGQHVFLTPK